MEKDQIYQIIFDREKKNKSTMLTYALIDAEIQLERETLKPETDPIFIHMEEVIPNLNYEIRKMTDHTKRTRKDLVQFIARLEFLAGQYRDEIADEQYN